MCCVTKISIKILLVFLVLVQFHIQLAMFSNNIKQLYQNRNWHNQRIPAVSRDTNHKSDNGFANLVVMSENQTTSVKRSSEISNLSQSLLDSFVTSTSSQMANEGRKHHKHKLKKKYQKLFLPLLIAYKLKFFTLIPVLIAGLILLVGTTGLAGFFFALFAAVMSMKSEHFSYKS